MSDEQLEGLGRLVGQWETEASHPAVPGVVVQGTATFEWLEGERFLINRARNDHPDFPDSISILGMVDDRLCMSYFDSRGVHRVYETKVEGDVWRLSRDEPGFEQRLAATISEDGDVMSGTWELAREPSEWKPDLAIAYRRKR
jgi:hypothetical protein